jgi:hypothetical protein
MYCDSCSPWSYSCSLWMSLYTHALYGCHCHCHTRTSRWPIKNYRLIGKKKKYLHLVLLGEKVLFKESPPSIMVTRNPDWSTEILWYVIGYTKGNILSPLKHPAWGRLHYWFCHKLLTFCWFMLCWFAFNIPDSGANEYSTTDTSNSGIGKYYIDIKTK